jgi:hypothetical protein
MRNTFAPPALVLMSMALASCGGNGDNGTATANEGAALNTDGDLGGVNAADDLTFGNETAAPAGSNEIIDNATADNAATGL